MDAEVLNAAKCPHHVQMTFAHFDAPHSIPDATASACSPNQQHWLAQ
jgi:hypothetical protein